jgi:hypothetical protein
VSGLTSKPLGRFLAGLASKLVATISPGLASKLMVDFLVEPQNQGGGGFPGLGLKTGRSGLVIWVSKSPRRFLGLGLKTKWASVCRLRHKTDGGRSAWDTRRDLELESSFSEIASLRSTHDDMSASFFGGSRYKNSKQTKRHISIPHGKSKI